ncbi:MAG: hypothetical protein GY702_27805 [Desulfobulbaceae bacterium]|nr:hypothetical protein [Desulfobulbaceae bacterium]
MIISKSSINSERFRLPIRTERVSKNTGLGLFGGLGLGLIFVAAGTCFILVGQKMILINPSRVYAPYWVISVFGGIFAMGGLIVWTKLLKEQLMIRRCRNYDARHPYATALKDYPWDPKGMMKSPWSRVGKSLFATLFLAVFLAPFNWWAWSYHESELMIKIIVSVFDIILVFVFIELVRRVLVALKYSKSGITYETFPALTGSRIDIKWLPPSGIEDSTSITFVLRCVEEWTESKGTVEHQRNRLIHEQLWAATQKMEGRIFCQHHNPILLSFDIPDTVPESNLANKRKIIFWELDVFTEAFGVDFQEYYLVPVYTQAAPSGV